MIIELSMGTIAEKQLHRGKMMIALWDYPKTDENNKFRRNEMIIELAMGTIAEKRRVTNVAP